MLTHSIHQPNTLKPTTNNTLKWLLIPPFLVIVLFAGSYLLRGIVIAPHVISLLESTIASQIGLEIKIGTLEGTYFSDIKIEDVTTVERSGEGPLTLLEVRRLKIKYHLMDLFGGFSTFLANVSLQIEGASVSIDLTGTEASALEDEPSFNLMLPEQLPKISIHNSTVSVKGSDFATGLKDFSLVLENKKSDATVAQLKTDHWWWRCPALRDGAVGLEAEAFYHNGNIHLNRLTAGKHALVETANVDLSAFPENMPFRLKLRLAGGDIEVKGALQKDHLAMNMGGSGIDTAVISKLLAAHYPLFGGTLSIRGQLDLPLDKPTDVAGDVQLHLQNPKFDDVGLEQINGKIFSGNGVFQVQALDMTVGSNRLTISQGSLAASAMEGDLYDILKSLSVEFSLQFDDIPSLLKPVGVMTESYGISTPDHLMILNGRFKNGVLNIPSGSFETEKGYIRLKPTEITLPEAGQPISEASVKGDLSINVPDLAFIGSIFELPSLKGTVRGNVKVTGSLSSLKGHADASASKVAFNGVELGNIDIEADMTGKRLTIKSAGFENGRDRLLFSGSLQTDVLELSDVKAKIDISDLGAYGRALSEPIDSISGAVKGTLQAGGALFKPEARADVRFENCHINGMFIENGNIMLRNSGQLLNIEQFDIRSDKGWFKAAGTVRHDLRGRQFDITLNQIAMGTKAPLLNLEKPSQIRINSNERIEVDAISLKGSAGRISLSGKYLPLDSADILIAAENVNSDNWLDLLVGDRIRFHGLNAGLRISGTVSSLSYSVQGSLDELSSPDFPRPFTSRFHLEHRNQVLSVKELMIYGGTDHKISVTGNLPFDPYGSYPFSPEAIELAGLVEIADAKTLNPLFKNIEISGGLIQSDFQIGGTWDRPVGGIHLNIKDLAITGEIMPLPPGPYEIVGNLDIDGDRISLKDFAATSPVLKARAGGEWAGAPTLMDLYSAGDFSPSGEIDMEGSLEAPDLSWIARGIEGIRRIAGRLEAKGSIRGLITSPDTDVVVNLSSGSLVLDSDMPSLESLDIEAQVSTEKADIKSVTGELGGAPFQLSGLVDFKSIDGSMTDLRLKGENLLLYRNENLRLRADVDLLLKGSLSQPSLTGGIAVSDGRFTQNFGVLEGLASAGKTTTDKGFTLFSIKDPPLRDMVFNIKITAKNPFWIRNNLFQGSARPNLALLGTGELPLLVGEIYLDPSRLYLPAGKMTLDSGLIRFDKSDPERPNIDMLGSASMLGYDITAVVSGPYDEPVVTLSSVPPLSNEELIMLLLSGQPPKSDQRRLSGGNRGANAAVFLGRDMLSRFSDNESENVGDLILDRFDIEVGRQITRRGEETINAKFLLADDIFLKGDSLYLTGEKDVFDYYNGGLRIVFRFR